MSTRPPAATNKPQQLVFFSRENEAQALLNVRHEETQRGQQRPQPFRTKLQVVWYTVSRSCRGTTLHHKTGSVNGEQPSGEKSGGRPGEGAPERQGWAAPLQGGSQPAMPPMLSPQREV
ncbi:hypothetical protein Vafri_20090 [Volvox africanus]|uniref:Uncharacterized protein n=1 Tax=Volvox africanus TaxID=51714 RepID=A0A8J4BSX5_9CHLO|nr:hypothetical protein Vafri_20090 [Volvox africanus]